MASASPWMASTDTGSSPGQALLRLTPATAAMAATRSASTQYSSVTVSSSASTNATSSAPISARGIVSPFTVTSPGSDPKKFQNATPSNPAALAAAGESSGTSSGAPWGVTTM